MNTLFTGLTVAFAGALALSTQGQVVVGWSGLNVAIPDGDLSGVADTHTVSGVSGTAIGSLTVTLNIAGTGDGAFNGDLFVALMHDGGYSVLLNRSGRSDANPAGYGDNGYSVTFSDAAANDVQSYRQFWSGSPGDTLTGNWQPSARAVGPDAVTDASPRTATLGSFGGLNPNGTWTLFLVDSESGGTASLASWSLSITSAPVPEPEAAGAFAAALAAWIGWRRVRRWGFDGMSERSGIKRPLVAMDSRNPAGVGTGCLSDPG
jgi:subtilisin-like proprotein convertase family protein